MFLFFIKAHFLIVILFLLDALHLRHKCVILFSTGVVYLNVTLGKSYELGGFGKHYR